jgi:hypothetical protein
VSVATAINGEWNDLDTLGRQLADFWIETPCVNPWRIGSVGGLAVKRCALCPAGSLR